MYTRLVGLCLLLITSPAHASTYAWNPAHRPPVSLREALTLAHEALQRAAKFSSVHRRVSWAASQGAGNPGPGTYFSS